MCGTDSKRVGGDVFMMIFIGLLFSLIGFGVLGSSISAVFKVRRRLAVSVKAMGNVFGFGKIMGRNGYLYCPQVEFQISNGQIFKFQSEIGTQPPAYQIGQPVQIVYQRTNPHIAEIDSATALWLAPGCLSLMGLMFLFIGFVLFGFGVLVEIKN